MMIKWNRILLATDFCKTARHALQYAVALARRAQAELYVQHVVPDYFAKFPHWTTLFDVRQLQGRIHGYVAGQLSELIPQAVRAQLPIKEVISQGRPSEEVLRFARENGIDLIVIGAHNGEKSEAAPFGSVAESIVRGADGPVLTVPPIAHHRVAAGDPIPPVQWRRILFPTDFSDYSRHALDYALSLSDEFQSKLILLSVVEYMTAIHYGIERDNLAHNMIAVLRWAEIQLGKIIPEEFKKRLEWEKLAVEGEPYQEILRVADEKQVDLIVLGAHGWGPIRKFFIGSTTEKVVRKAHGPVLTVKF